MITPENPLPSSTYDLYSASTSKGEIPSSLSLPNYQPELNYYLQEVLKLMDDDIQFTQQQISILFDMNVNNF